MRSNQTKRLLGQGRPAIGTFCLGASTLIAEGCRNAREILSVPGVDACFIGPNDLSITLGVPPGLTELPPPVEDAVAVILAAARATGKVAGIQVFNTQAAKSRIEQGFRFVSVMSEFEMVRDGAGEVLKAVNGLGATRRDET